MKNLILLVFFAVSSLAATAQTTPERALLSMDAEKVSDKGVARLFHKLVTEMTYDEAILAEHVIMNDADGIAVTFDNNLIWQGDSVIEHVSMYEVEMLGQIVRAWVVTTEDPSDEWTFTDEVMITVKQNSI